MVPSFLPTWQSLLDKYVVDGVPNLAPLARDYYAQQGRLLSAASYLALAPTAASEPFLHNPQAREMTENPEFADTKAEADFWRTTTAAWQEQVQRQIDQNGRNKYLEQQWQAQPFSNTLLGLRGAVAAEYSLPALATLPVNQLALAFWKAGVFKNKEQLAEVLEALRGKVGQILGQNYPDAEQTSQLLAALGPELAPLAQALLAAGSGKVRPLSMAWVDELIAALSSLPANHPFLYAVAEWWQHQLRQVLATEPLPPLVKQLPPVTVRGQLLGQQEEPLAGFALCLTQQAGEQPDAEAKAASQQLPRTLGVVRTDEQGRFALQLPRVSYLTTQDEVAEVPAQLQAEVYFPGQSTDEKPATQLTLATDDQDGKHVYRTDLPATAPLAPSRTMDSLALPGALCDLLKKQGLVSLADVRASEGVVRLVASQLPDDPEAVKEAQRLDGLAQFEVLGAGSMALAEQAVAAGFYSPAQVTALAQEEFVARLAETTGEPDDTLRPQATAFYRQATATQALAQALGLLAFGAASASSPADAASPARPLTLDGDQPDDSLSGGVEATSPQARLINPAQPTTTDAPTRPGYTIADGFDPAPAGQVLTYQAGGQCDCPSCRSAVSPTAYLASLLNYATQNLRTSQQAGPSLQQLQDTFRQPFGDLNISCQTAEEQVCQYRLAIEVLQVHRRANAPGVALTVGNARAYVAGVLEALLQAVGLSLSELQATDTAGLPTLAERLALPQSVVEALHARFSATQLADTRLLSDVEADLAELFGLASTAADPLRTGILLAQSANSGIELVRWQLRGVEYGLNTNREGELCIQLEPNGQQPHLTVYAGQPAEDNVVARGTLLETDAATQTFAGQLQPQHGSGLGGTVVARVGGSSPATFTLSVVPLVTAGRQQTLATEWLRQDADAIALLQAHTLPSWNGTRALIDPDLLGPDDFRPVVRSQPDYLNVALTLWRRRYEFVQYGFLNELLAAIGLPALPTTPFDGNSLTALLDMLTQVPVTYTPLAGGPLTTPPWGAQLQSGTDLLTQLCKQLDSSQAADQQAAASTLDAYQWSPEAARRLYELWQHSLSSTITPSETEEALDLVRQSFKGIISLLWAQEETDPAVNVSLHAFLFHQALHEPRSGTWTAVRDAEFGWPQELLPAVDPDEVTPLDLPDAGFGDVAAELWSSRQAELLAKRQALETYVQTLLPDPLMRANALLDYARQPVPLNPVPQSGPPSGTLEQTWLDYQNDLSLQQGAARTYFREVLSLRPAEATRLMDLRAQALANPAAGLWAEMAAALVPVWKRAVAYKQAYALEGSTNPDQLHWYKVESQTLPGAFDSLERLMTVRKHRLVKWRASETHRQAWVQALALAMQRPLIDPDQLVPGDFRQAGERSRDAYQPPLADPDKPYANPAFELCQQRWQYVQQTQGSLLQDWSSRSAADRWQLVSARLHATQPELEALHTQLHAGVDVSLSLRRLNLSPAGLDLLLGQLNPTVGTPNRADEVAHLLTQQFCYYKYAVWAREEIALGVTATPYYFRRPGTEPESLATQPWRSSAVARRRWQRTLTARFGQMAALTTAQQQAVKAAEDQWLGTLRDALLQAGAGTPTPTLTELATQMEERYLLDFQTACCQHTTRVAQASTVLQKLFANVRGGLPNNGLTLRADNTTFEHDWQWLGSYERWRSLLFLYLYPQNVLLPTLRPGQTSQFRQTVQAVRQAARTTPADARDYMDDYQKFVTDMGSLQVATATQTTLTPAPTDGFGTSAQPVPVSVQAALAASHLAYANVFSLSSSPAENAFAWSKIPGSSLVERIVGSAAYQPASGERYVYVFVLLREEQKEALAQTVPVTLAFQRLSLRTLSWDSDYTSLTLSGEGEISPEDVLVAERSDEQAPPVIAGLRNRRYPLMSEFPFSTLRSTLTGPVSQVVYGGKNVDLFHAVLDVQGTGLALELTRTFLLIDEVRLLGCLYLDGTLLHFAAVRTGVTKSLKFQALAVSLNPYSMNYYKRPGYIIANDLYALTLNAVSNQGGGSYTTPAFDSFYSYPAPATYFRDIVGLLQNGNAGRIPGYAVGYVTANPFCASTGAYLALPQSYITSEVRFVGLRVTDAPPAPYTRNGFEQAVIDVYYNEVNGYGPELSTNKVTVCLDSIHNLYFGSSASSPPFSPSQALSQVNDAYSSCYQYVGPAGRSIYAVGESALSTSPVISYYPRVGISTVYPTVPARATLALPAAATTYVLHQALPELPPLFSPLTAAGLAARHNALPSSTTLATKGFVQTLVGEAYYALPMLLAQELTRSRNYELALHYYRLVYDYTKVTSSVPNPARLVYPALASSGTPTYDTVLAWLTTPDNPYTLAALRPNSHLDYVVMSVVRCLLAYADAEFTADTSESVDRARTLYELAARLLKQDVTQQAVPGTAELLDPLDVLLPAAWLAEWQSLKAVLARVNQRAVLEQLLNRVAIDGVSGRPGLVWLFTDAKQGNRSWAAAFEQAWRLVNGQLDALPGGYLSLGTSASSAAATASATLPPFTLPPNSVRPYVPFLNSATFCVPDNPVPFALALQAELNLFKIRSCRNIAGIQRELDPYAAATDNTTGLPMLSSTGQLVSTGRLVVPATPFRYAYILERARSLVALAQQTEAALLAALEKRDAEAYGLLRARQDIATSQATVQLQTLRVTEAEDGATLADLQLEKSQLMEDQYDEWLSNGLSAYEQDMLFAIMEANSARRLQNAVQTIGSIQGLISSSGTGKEGMAGAAGVYYALAGLLTNDALAAEGRSQVDQHLASFQRRTQEWQFQRNLAAQEIKINQQQIRIANDQVKVVGQEKRIAQLQLDHASAVLNFLTTKFTNAELYDWMSGILESAYEYFLQQATATARLAEQQLAFERQQVPAGIVQEDYYSAPADDLAAIGLGSDGSGSSATDRKGLTGSVRLLQDLTRLDEYAFETTRRKLQLTKTISLAQRFPAEFVRFRETGQLSFACQPEWFDQDFPGHYLRIVRRVRTSVIALVPPVEGVKARLGTAGNSHVTVDGTPFQTLTLPRAPEGVALTAPLNATGLFELEPQSQELLYPFEGLGVDVPWTFAMPPASNSSLDYSAVADVLLTLDYTALESYDYARQVVQRLGTERQQQVVLSLRNRFADQWYDLHHADEVAAGRQYVSTLTITPDDLPRNLRNVSVSQVSVYVDVPLDDTADGSAAFTDRSQLPLALTRSSGTGTVSGGEARTNQYGLISTRSGGSGTGALYNGNATAFAPLIGPEPVGDWTLTVKPGRLRDRLAAGLVNDIYLILEVTGDVPAYVL